MFCFSNIVTGAIASLIIFISIPFLFASLANQTTGTQNNSSGECLRALTFL